MSGTYWALLWRRAERFMKRAERDLQEGDFDGACFNSEQAVQLAVKATLYKLFGEKPCINSSKTLLIRLRNLLYEAGREGIASEIDALFSTHRRDLELLEESYIESRYGEFEYPEPLARKCIEAAEKAMEMLKRVEGQLA